MSKEEKAEKKKEEKMIQEKLKEEAKKKESKRKFEDKKKKGYEDKIKALESEIIALQSAPEKVDIFLRLLEALRLSSSKEQSNSSDFKWMSQYISIVFEDKLKQLKSKLPPIVKSLASDAEAQLLQ